MNTQFLVIVTKIIVRLSYQILKIIQFRMIVKETACL